MRSTLNMSLAFVVFEQCSELFFKFSGIYMRLWGNLNIAVENLGPKT